MLADLVDIRNKLARNPAGGPGRSIPLTDKWGLVVHYNGPPVPEARADVEQLVIDAEYHVGKDWDEDPANGDVLKGDGLMYHVAIGRDGRRYQCRDLGAVLWHCGAWPANKLALSVLVVLGGNQRATTAQLRSLSALAYEWQAAGRCDRASVWGHQELSRTDCPGTLMGDFVLPWRGEGGRMSDGFWFKETGHYVGGAFWQHWCANGGLVVFGYPLSEELQEDAPDAPGYAALGVPRGKRIVQYFERYKLVLFPEFDAPWRVQGADLGRVAARAAGVTA